MAIGPGSRLGAYEVTALIGEGGMGKVYRARDPKLNRVIAIKILPQATANDAERRARFEREAQSVAALNHPNIVTIHSVEEADGVLFLTMELVEGRPLSDLVVKGGLPLVRILPLAIPLADAISAAHQKGITHRDLKPANVMITPDGRVKVLDFGLAKLAEPSPASTDVTALPTGVLTVEGHIVGTVAYMSPEQAEGKPVDHRSDIFSLGIMLYEMATGERPFKGETPASTISSILRDTPRSITELNQALPRDLTLIVRRCLAKDPEQRTQSAKDVRNQLEDLQHAADSGELIAPAPHTATPRGRSLRRSIAALAVVAVLAAVGTWMLTRLRVHDTSVVTEVARLTHDAGLSEWPTWSPDDSLLAFASNRNGNFEIYVRRVEGGQEVNVTNNASENFQPAFSPDGNSIAFVSTRASRTRMVKVSGRTSTQEGRTYGGDVWVVPTLGGQARRLAPDGNFPVWHPGAQKVAYVSGPEAHRSILEVAAGGMPQTVLASAASSWEIVRVRYSPHASWITFDTADSEVFIVPLAGGRPRKLVSGFSHEWESSGEHLYYLVRDAGGGTRLQSVGIDERTGNITGRSSTVGLMTGVVRDLAVSHKGQQLALTEAEGSMNLSRLPLTADGGAPAGAEEVLSAGQVFDGQPSVSPDGQRIAYVSNRLGDDQIWVLHLDSKQMEVLQPTGNDVVSTVGPHWHPDGRRLLVQRFFANGKLSLWWIAADASASEELTSPPGLYNNAEGWPIAPDGRRIVYAADVNGHSQLFEFDLTTRQARQLTFSTDDKFSAVFSADGRWLVYTSNANGSDQLWRIPAGSGQAEALTKGDDRVRHMFYSPDGRWLYFQPNHLNIYRMPADGGSVEQVTHFPESGLFLEEPTISPDGRYLVYSRSNGGSSLWVLRLGSAEAQVR
jgi:eukaryotic-like serine/threonine-protein kinase